MLRAALRVAARAVAIQAEEAAAAASSAAAVGSAARYAAPRDRRRGVEVQRELERERDAERERDRARESAKMQESEQAEEVVQRAMRMRAEEQHKSVARAALQDGEAERVKREEVLRRAGVEVNEPPIRSEAVAQRKVKAVKEAERAEGVSTTPEATMPPQSPIQPAPTPVTREATQKVDQEVSPDASLRLNGARHVRDQTRNSTAEIRVSDSEPIEPVEPVPSAPLGEPSSSTTASASSPDAAPVDALDSVSQPLQDVVDWETPTPVQLRPSKVPNSRLGRLLHYGSLVAGMSMGAASEAVRRSTGGGSSGSVFMSEANVRRLVDKLGRMRGAALKLGQFMSIQDSNMLPEQLERVLQQVQANAHYMPDWQLEDVMTRELGPEWSSLFASFERVPIAAASIGQVHRATFADGTPVAVKVQFPGIAESITSDLDNLSLLLKTSALLPRGLYLDNTLAVMRRELADECDYVKEAAAGRRFREYLADDPFFEVPAIVEEATTPRVLTTEMMSGRPLSQVKHLSQETRDKIGEAVLRLCLKELFAFRFMQTDPNWANFLYDQKRDKLQLIDFGASRQYTVEFMDNWYRLLTAALANNRDEMVKQSQRLRYLTGEEDEIMVDAHVRSMSLLSIPFNTPGIYDFGHQSVTDEVRKLIPTMLKHRLTPPPNETYSLNRKLSGCFLLCTKLGARVDCKALWEEVVGAYRVTT